MSKPPLLTRVSRALRRAVNGTAGVGTSTMGIDAAAGWMGPGVPLAPVAPPEVAGRRFDFPTGINFNVQPRHEVTTFAELRRLADGYDLLRLVIETRKDQLCSLKWSIQSRDPLARRGKEPDTATRKIIEFLHYPDHAHSWSQWIRMLVEDMLVIDAATLYPRLTRGGDLYALEIVDGATIHPLIDDWGRTPLPPLPAYQQVLKGIPAQNYRADELLYLPRNMRSNRLYGYSPVEQVRMTVDIALRRQMSQLQYYTDGSTPDLVFGVPDSWQPAQVREFEDYWNSVLAGNTAARRQARFVPGGVKPFDTKERGLKDEYDEWLARIVCYAFSVSAQWAVKQMNRATAEVSEAQAVKEGLDPLKAWVKEVIDRVLTMIWQRPDLELLWEEEEEQKPVDQATVDEKYLKLGVLTINEIRTRMGLDPLSSGGDESLIFTTTGVVPLELALATAETQAAQQEASLEGMQNPGQQQGAALSQNQGGKNPQGGEAEEDGAPSDDEDDTADGDEPTARRLKKKAQSVEVNGGVEKSDRPIHRSFGPSDRQRRIESELSRVWQAFFAGARAEALHACMAASLVRKADALDSDDPAASSIAASSIVTETEPGATEAEAGATAVARLLSLIQSRLATLAWSLIQDDSARLLAPAALEGGEAAVAEVRIGLPDVGGHAFAINLRDDEAAQWARQNAAQLVKGVEASTRARIASLVADTQTGDLTTPELARAIATLLQSDTDDVASNAFSAARAQLIARTELSRGSHQGMLLGWQAMMNDSRAHGGSLTIRKRWGLGNESVVCDICRTNAAAGALDLAALFPSGDTAPPEHPNCNCTLISEVATPVPPADHTDGW